MPTTVRSRGAEKSVEHGQIRRGASLSRKRRAACTQQNRIDRFIERKQDGFGH
jgi:hypothetical protein